MLAVELGERAHVLARELHVVVDEGLLALDAELMEQIPQFHHVGERAPLVVGPIAHVAMQGLVGFVQKLMKAAHRGVAGVLGHPGLDLPVHCQVGLVHLAIGLVAHRSDQNAAEGVQIEPGHDVRMPNGELHDGAGLRGAAGKVPGSNLLRLGLPLMCEVAIEIVQVVRQEMRVGNALAIEIDDVPFRVELVEGAGIFGQARHHDWRAQWQAIVTAQLR